MRILRIFLAWLLVLIIGLQGAIPHLVFGKPPEQLSLSAVSDSRNWSGYVAGSGEYTGVGATWMVPNRVVEGDYGVSATWVGIGGASSTDLIQAGTQRVVTANGLVTYEAFYEMLPMHARPFNVNVSGGDIVTVSVKNQKNDTWLIEFKNETNGESVGLITTYKSSMSSADWIQEAPSSRSRVLPLDDFGFVQITDGWAIKDGKKLNLSQANPQPIDMSSHLGEKLATTSGLGVDGASFIVRRSAWYNLMDANTF